MKMAISAAIVMSMNIPILILMSIRIPIAMSMVMRMNMITAMQARRKADASDVLQAAADIVMDRDTAMQRRNSRIR